MSGATRFEQGKPTGPGRQVDVAPLDLLTPERLDVVVKWRFARHLIDGGDPRSAEVYRWHIMVRTGGNEANPAKRGLEDYVEHFRALLTLMDQNGFDRRFGIHYSGVNRRLFATSVGGGGAHRIAAALALGIKTIPGVEYSDAGRYTWGEGWFRRHGLPEADLGRILEDYRCLKD